MTNLTTMFSSDKDYWETPQSLFDELNAESNFTLDAAASDANHKCEKYFTKRITVYCKIGRAKQCFAIRPMVTGKQDNGRRNATARHRNPTQRLCC